MTAGIDFNNNSFDLNKSSHISLDALFEQLLLNNSLDDVIDPCRDGRAILGC
jgi:hypothetical protein